MDNGTAAPAPAQLSPEAVAAAVSVLHEATVKAFEGISAAILSMVERQKEAAETINQLAADRNSQLEIVGTVLNQVETLSAQILVLTKLVDNNRAAIEVLMTIAGLNGKSAKC